jgi:hypothetical protein
MLTKRYQSGKLQQGWDEVAREMKLQFLLPEDVVVLMRSMFFAGAVFTATHLKYAEEIMEEGLEKFDLER